MGRISKYLFIIFCLQCFFVNAKTIEYENLFTLKKIEVVKEEKSSFLVKNEDLKKIKDMEMPLYLNDFVIKVIKQNADLILFSLQTQIEKHKIKFEKGILNPIFNLSFIHKDIHIPNDIDKTLTQLSKEYKEVSEEYELGLGGLLHYGTKWNLKIVQNKKDSSIIEQNKTGVEYSHNLDLSIKQPLLKNFGKSNTLIKIDVAKANHKVITYEYKKNMMDLVSIAIQYYWRLYGLQELKKSWEESLDIAYSQLNDIKVKVENGKLANSELLDVKTAINLRKIELESVNSKLVEIQAQILSLLNISTANNQKLSFKILDKPNKNLDIPSFEESFELAVKTLPEFDILENKKQINELMLAFAKNQTLPEFNFLGSMSRNSLEKSSNSSWKTANSNDFESWYAGVEFIVPLGNYRAKENLNIEKIKRLKLKYEKESLLRKVNNDLYTKLNKLTVTKKQMNEYIQGLSTRKQLVDIKLMKLKYGKISSDELFEEQEKYISFQRKYLNNIIELKLSNALLEKATGKLLNRFNIRVENNLNNKFIKDGKYEIN